MGPNHARSDERWAAELILRKNGLPEGLCLFCTENLWRSYVLPVLAVKKGLGPGAWQMVADFNGLSPRLQNLVDTLNQCLPKGLVPVELYNDPEVHEAELNRIFTRVWVYVGHESEVPDKGDYCLRYIGEDRFIFVRDENGELRVIFDSCRHRGAQVCRADKGNASHFRCPYHGWTYKNTGRLLNSIWAT